MVLRIIVKLLVWMSGIMSLVTGIWAIFNSTVDMVIISAVCLLVVVILDKLREDTDDDEY